MRTVHKFVREAGPYFEVASTAPMQIFGPNNRMMDRVRHHPFFSRAGGRPAGSPDVPFAVKVLLFC